MLYKPSAAYYTTFTTQDATGAATDADSLPTASARKNGTTDAAFTLTVTKISTGLYKITGTIPSYSAGDVVQTEVSATVGGVAGKAVVDQFQIDTQFTSEVYTRIGTAGAGLTALGDTRLANLDATVSSRNATTPPTVAAIRTEMDSNSTKLAHLDADISSRSTYAGGAVASVTGAVGSVTGAVTVGTNNDKTGYALASAPPTATANATAVRTELATELGRIDVATSTRSSHSAADVWAVTTRTLSSFGTLASDAASAIWSAATRTLSAFSFTVTTNANATETAIKAKTDQLTFDATGVVASAAIDTSGLEISALTTDQSNQLARINSLITAPIVPAAQAASIDAGALTIRRGDTFATAFELGVSATGYDKLWLTLKRDKNRDADSAAKAQIIAGTGLAILNGAAASDATQGSLSLDVDGVTLSIMIDEAATAQLVPASGAWDVQLLKNGIITTIAEGTWQVLADVTRAVA